MTTIKATCPGCGEVDLTADDILLRIGNVGLSNTYGFTCPDCTDYVEKVWPLTYRGSPHKKLPGYPSEGSNEDIER